MADVNPETTHTPENELPPESLSFGARLSLIKEHPDVVDAMSAARRTLRNLGIVMMSRDRHWVGHAAAMATMTDRGRNTLTPDISRSESKQNKLLTALGMYADRQADKDQRHIEAFDIDASRQFLRADAPRLKRGLRVAIGILRNERSYITRPDVVSEVQPAASVFGVEIGQPEIVDAEMRPETQSE